MIVFDETHIMTSRSVISPPLPTQSKYLHENQYQTKHHQVVNIHWNSYSKIDQKRNSSLFSHSTGSNRSCDYVNIPYASNVYGVYRRPPSNLTSPPFIYTNQNRVCNLKNKSRHSQANQLSHGNSDDYCSLKYEDLHGIINSLYGNEKPKKNHKYHSKRKHTSNYTSDKTGVSFK